MRSLPAPADLALLLPAGAREELDLTPTPGLVDREDSGSHPDLSVSKMLASIELLRIHFDELLALSRSRRPVAESIEAGRRAEVRMLSEVGSNAHRGLIFLGGLLLLAAAGDRSRPVRERIAALARVHFDHAPADLGTWNGHGGIRAESLAGLPSVFETGLPAFQRALRVAGDRTGASFLLMARLMQTVDDTTAIRRCGEEGLIRLRRDGAQLEARLVAGRDPRPFLRRLNAEYREMRLTMGGVADCMAIVFALAPAHAPAERRRTRRDAGALVP